MDVIDRFVVGVTKAISRISSTLGLGAGGTWPGEIALFFRPRILETLANTLPDGVVLVAGTNGKTTTSLMIKTILEASGKRVVHNATGANLLNGIVSALIQNPSADVGIFEVDENSLPQVLKSVKSIKSKVTIVLLNLFRDQLDRYGEVDVIVEKWQKALEVESRKSVKSKVLMLILNADDPAVASLGNKAAMYFGLNDAKKFLKIKEHATDSTFCPQCGSRLVYDGVYYSHIGIWRCEHCGMKRPKPTIDTWPNVLPGLYNQYNTLAAVAVAKSLHISESTITHALTNFTPAFGRQEEIGNIKLFLSKNPAGFNASLRAVLEMGARNLLFVLNDRIPDGRDVSWIWDVDFEMLPKDVHIIVSGDRVYDIALRMKYADSSRKSVKSKGESLPAGKAGRKIIIEPDLGKALSTKNNLFVLATYSAMLEVRKILTGKKI